MASKTVSHHSGIKVRSHCSVEPGLLGTNSRISRHQLLSPLPKGAPQLLSETSTGHLYRGHARPATSHSRSSTLKLLGKAWADFPDIVRVFGSAVCEEPRRLSLKSRSPAHLEYLTYPAGMRKCQSSRLK